LSIWAFVKAHWRPVAAVGSIALAFLFGRFSAPTRTVERAVEHTVYRDREVKVQEAAKVEIQERVVFRDRTIIKRVDGTVIQRDVERTDTGQATATATRQEETRVEYRDREVVKEKRVDAPKDWSVALLVGSSLSLKPIGLGPVVYGASVQRRIIGPVSVGLWGLSNGTGGLSAGVTF
jgi:hypothetical protein